MKNLENIAMEASIAAGKAIMEVYETDFDVEIKDDTSPLTLADQKANAVINSFLGSTGIPIISEENKQLPYSERKDWDTCWIVDPLDGTKEFIKRNGEFTVNIALVEKGNPVLGVIYVPVSGELYVGNVKDKTAKKFIISDHKGSSKGEQLAMELSPCDVTNPVRVVGSRSHMNDDTLSYINRFEAKGMSIEVVSKGSSLKFCLVAEGSADVYPRFAPTMEWDTAAGQAICNAVGIEVIAQDTMLPLVYNKENLLNPYFTVNHQ